MENTEEKKETIIEWASKRPVWEKYIWEKCLKHGSMSSEDYDDCYDILLAEYGLLDEEFDLPEISLESLVPPQDTSNLPVKIKTIKECENINAIPKDQELNFNDDLTIIFGSNGTGKSGFGRLFAEACFSRGKRTLLPNVKENDLSVESKAKFIFDGGSEVVFTKGEMSDSKLLRFSVFDDKSVPIYLDGSNALNFVPGELKTFDLVYECIQEIEQRFLSDKQSRKIENPSELLFQPENVSELSSFLRGLDASIPKEELIGKIQFTDQHQQELAKSESEKSTYQKNDPGTLRSNNTNKISALNTYQSRFQSYVSQVTKTRIDEVNRHVNEYNEKKQLVEQLGAKQFDKGILKTIGNEKWKALIIAAKELNDVEVGAGNDLKHCMLCNQELHEKERSLFEAYWEFLKGSAEKEFASARNDLAEDLAFAKQLKQTIPTTDSQNMAIAIFESESRKFAERLKKEIQKFSRIIDDWIAKVSAVEKIDYYEISEFTIGPISDLISEYESSNVRLGGSFTEIKRIDESVRKLKHLKTASNNQDKIIAYHDTTTWLEKSNSVAFQKNLYTTTRKRFFIQIITEDYTRLFNEEATVLECPSGLKLATRGKSGDTELQLGLDYWSKNVSDILSEGQQKVTALADFLTEVRINKNNCGIIFDDPVTSLDHERKELIAKRLVGESKNRQVIIFTHDIVFVSMLVRNASEEALEYSSHWITSRGETPGIIEENSSPRLSNLSSLKTKAQNSLAGYRDMSENEKENALTIACDALRSACEALIREKVFCNSVERYGDRVSIQVLEEMPLSRDLINSIVEMHGRISEIGLMHDRSDLVRENTNNRKDFDKAFQDFREIEKKLDKARTEAKTERKKRKSEIRDESHGWL
ncbi:MAG: hypothetical protein RIF46_06285 [Cyclobacteriaceae bacterium]